MNEFDKAKQYVYNNISKEIKIIYSKKINDIAKKIFNTNINYNVLGLFIIYKNNSREIVIDSTQPKEIQSKTLLHEYCHSVTWRDEFFNGEKLQYLREYVAEKMLRRICKKNNWNDILKISNNWVYENSNSCDPIYKYCSKRIIREEKL